MHRILLFFFFFSFFSPFTHVCKAQDARIWQLSGLVISEKTNDPVSFVRVFVNHTRRGIVSNEEGFYSIPVLEADTLFFMRLGYKPSYLVMKDYLAQYGGDKESPYLYSVNYLQEDSIVLKTVKIYPYDTPEKLKTAMLNMENPYFSEERFARDNLDPRALKEYIDNMEIDREERAVVARTVYYDQHQNKNIAPVMPLFDPVAVYRLLKYISERAKNKKRKDLNYWE